ncbi:MAG TPA: hypothetical protein VJT74_17295 [Pyrinomonadaceae bacterium]|nr:hypothetical protein [Pyrinomonadaceae bacterium]
MAQRLWGISKKFGTLPPTLKKALRIGAALALWAFLLWRATVVFGPSTDINDIPYSSDSAIPILMSNDERPITPFSLYYYGTDRWGAWPFLLTKLAHRATGCRWTDQSLFVMQVAWLFIGALVVVGLGGRDGMAAALAYLAALCLHRESRLQIFELSQLYAWQVGALLFGWYGLRRLYESYLSPADKRPGLGRAAWLFLILFFSFLAVWSSQASIIFLFILVHLEALRAWAKGREQHEGRRLLKPYLLCFAAVAAAALLERLQKWNYHRHGWKHYGRDFATHFNLDSGHLADNFAAQFAHISGLSWWPLYLLPTLGLLALVGCVGYALLTRRAGLLEKLRSAPAEDALILAAGAYAIAAVNFTLTLLVDHVRLNLYDDRFLTLTNLFGPASGLLTVFLLLRLVARSARRAADARPAFLLVMSILLVVKFPPLIHAPIYDLIEEGALVMERREPRAVIMGSYWETYMFAGLQTENTMTAVPLEGEELRMPWTKAEVRRARHIILARWRPAAWAEVPMPERLEQYGASLRLADPKWFNNGWFVFALYLNETQ